MRCEIKSYNKKICLVSNISLTTKKPTTMAILQEEDAKNSLRLNKQRGPEKILLDTLKQKME